MSYPEDIVNWLEHQPYLCQIWELRDCPGCVVRCGRTGEILPSSLPLQVVMRDE